ncbi:MAG: Fur family transcriptional regulator [Acidobacteriota bacterium]|nr:Fur family transcriptional regulator [Acidobacteriota bacterium]
MMNARDDKAARRAEIEKICREHGLPLTAQRRIVLETLPKLNHPAVDEIWEQARESMPEVSRTTVYRTLEMFSKLRIIRKVCHPGAVARYEDKTNRHHHLLCLRCGKMTDLDDPSLDKLHLPGAGTGYQIEDYSIQFRGLCKKCMADKKHKQNL